MNVESVEMNVKNVRVSEWKYECRECESVRRDECRTRKNKKEGNDMRGELCTNMLFRDKLTGC